MHLVLYLKRQYHIPKVIQVFSCFFTPRNFTVSHFTANSTIYFYLIFVQSVRSMARFIFFLLADFQLFYNHLFKRLFLLHCITFLPLLKIS